MKYCIRLYQDDNVATVLAHVKQGDELTVLDIRMQKAGVIRAAEDIPFAHKIGLREIVNRGIVIKCGERIGRATRPIPKGSYVHVHNVVSIEGTTAVKNSDGRGEAR